MSSTDRHEKSYHVDSRWRCLNYQVRYEVLFIFSNLTNSYRSTIHDTIQGTGFWPQAYDGRAIIGESYKDHLAGLPEDANFVKYKDALATGDSTRRTVWA